MVGFQEHGCLPFYHLSLVAIRPAGLDARAVSIEPGQLQFLRDPQRELPYLLGTLIWIRSPAQDPFGNLPRKAHHRVAFAGLSTVDAEPSSMILPKSARRLYCYLQAISAKNGPGIICLAITVYKNY